MGTKFNPAECCRIDNIYMYDMGKKTGYRVEKDSRGTIVNYCEAFRLYRDADGFYRNSCKLEIPIGILRKAANLQRLYSEKE